MVGVEDSSRQAESRSKSTDLVYEYGSYLA